MIALVLIYAAAGAALCLTMFAMAALLLSVALYADWRDEVRA